MRKRTMRWLAMFLALIMVFTVLPLTAMAETTAGVRAELVTDASQLKAMDDAAECMWIAPEDIHTELFGLRSVRQGLYEYLNIDGNRR